MFGLPLSADDLDLYRRCTGREDAPATGFKEAFPHHRPPWWQRPIVLALIAVFLAAFHDWSALRLFPASVQVWISGSGIATG